MATALTSYLTGAAMHCTRCSGLMVPIWLNDVALDEGPNDILAWRCVACGEVIDPVILAHRRPRVEHVKGTVSPKGSVPPAASSKSRLVKVA